MGSSVDFSRSHYAMFLDPNNKKNSTKYDNL